MCFCEWCMLFKQIDRENEKSEKERAIASVDASLFFILIFARPCLCSCAVRPLLATLWPKTDVNCDALLQFSQAMQRVSCLYLLFIFASSKHKYCLFLLIVYTFALEWNVFSTCPVRVTIVDQVYAKYPVRYNAIPHIHCKYFESFNVCWYAAV